MLSHEELIDGVHQLVSGPHTFQNCEKLAAIYTVLDHLYPTEPEKTFVGYSSDSKPDEVGVYGDSEFLTAVSGKRPEMVFELLDELMSTVKVLYPKLYDNAIVKIMDL